MTLSPRAVAKQAGVSTDTLRHYERKGLLPAPPRTASGYRRYPATAVERVQLIQRALGIGFSLDELVRVLRDRDRGGAPCRGVLELVKTRLVDLEDRLREMSALRREMRTLVADWENRVRDAKGKPAHLLEGLAGRGRTVRRGFKTAGGRW